MSKNTGITSQINELLNKLTPVFLSGHARKHDLVKRFVLLSAHKVSGSYPSYYFNKEHAFEFFYHDEQQIGRNVKCIAH